MSILSDLSKWLTSVIDILMLPSKGMGVVSIDDISQTLIDAASYLIPKKPVLNPELVGLVDKLILLDDDSLVEVLKNLPITQVNTVLAARSIRLRKKLGTSAGNNLWRQLVGRDFIESDVRYSDDWEKTYKELYGMTGHPMSFGNNYAGKLGTGTFSNNLLSVSSISYPDVRIKDARCAQSISMLLDIDNNLWGCGRIPLNGEFSNVNSFTRIKFPDDDLKVKKFSCSNSYVVVIDTNGDVWVMGSDEYYGIGLGDIRDAKVLIKINMHNIEKVSCGDNHTVMIDSDGKLWGFGYALHGQLGITTGNDRVLLPVNIPFGPKASDVYCRSASTFVVDTNGKLWGCGFNELGNLGLGDFDNRKKLTGIAFPGEAKIIKVAISTTHTVILDANGDIWGTGSANRGELGKIDQKITIRPPTRLAENLNTRVVSKFLRIAFDSRVKNVGCMSAGTLILAEDGGLWYCGEDMRNYTGMITIDIIQPLSQYSFATYYDPKDIGVFTPAKFKDLVGKKVKNLDCNNDTCIVIV